VILKEGDKIELGGVAAFWVFAPYSMTLDILTVGMTVTIMFTDIVESTALTDRLGDSLARSVLRTHCGRRRPLRSRGEPGSEGQ